MKTGKWLVLWLAHATGLVRMWVKYEVNRSRGCGTVGQFVKKTPIFGQNPFSGHNSATGHQIAEKIGTAWYLLGTYMSAEFRPNL